MFSGTENAMAVFNEIFTHFISHILDLVVYHLSDLRKAY